jgi:SseB protein N-terminal domain
MVEADVVAALAAARVFVPVVAVADEDAHVAVLTVTGVDGRRALPVFTSPEALTRWRPDARPVPVPGRRAALSAVAEGCDLLDLDPAGPVPYVVRRPAVWCVGRGLTWIPSYADPLVAQEISALSGGEGLESRAEPGGSAELRIVLGLPAGLDADEVQRIVGRFERALSRSERIAESVDSVEVVVRPLGQRPHDVDD